MKASQRTPEESNGLYLTKQEVTADSWLLLFAGHETTANTLHFTFLYLAITLSTQSDLQHEIDSIVGSRAREEWTYEKDMRWMFWGCFHGHTQGLGIFWEKDWGSIGKETYQAHTVAVIYGYIEIMRRQGIHLVLMQDRWKRNYIIWLV